MPEKKLSAVGLLLKKLSVLALHKFIARDEMENMVKFNENTGDIYLEWDDGTEEEEEEET